MKKKFLACLLALSLALPLPVLYAAEAETESADSTPDTPDVLRDIFAVRGEEYTDGEDGEKPYRDGQMLSEVREPTALYSSGGEIYGHGAPDESALAWESLGALSLPTGNVTIGGKSYALTARQKILFSSEGNLDGDGRKNELALLTAVKTENGGSLLILGTAKAPFSEIFPAVVLYDSKTSGASGDFYADTTELVNSFALVCADINGDGYDEIVTTCPTSGFAGASSGDKYGFDNFGGAYLWTLTDENRTSESFHTAGGWNAVPRNLGVGLQLSVDVCHIGAPGVTVSLAAGDVNGDGRDDIVSAISSTKIQYNANYSSNMFAVYYIEGSDDLSALYSNRKLLTNYIDADTRKTLSLSITNGNAASFDAKIYDVDGSGKPTVFLSLKETVHSWAAFSGKYMLTPSFYVLAFDRKENGAFTSSVVYHGGIYHNGWLDASEYSDTDYVYRTDPVDCAPVRIGLLKNDFGASDGKKAYLSSGTLIADQKLISFVRYADGDTYRYETKDRGAFTGSWGRSGETAYGYKTSDCVFYDNGINVAEIRTANVSFDGKTYTDTALVRAYTSDGKFRIYFLSKDGTGYTLLPSETLRADGKDGAAIAMPDTDADSICLRYNKHVFFWSDPIIVAALASPPYFDSLPSDMYTNSQTTYGRSASSSSGQSESFTVSAGAYISTEIKAGSLGTAGVFESESEAMRSHGSGGESTREVTFSQSFSTSGGEDTVVLTTIGYDAYAYTAYYPGVDGELASAPYIVYVPRGGSEAIRTASLNYEDYLSFIPYANGALPDLSDVFTHTVGKPETYPTSAPSGSGVKAGSILAHKNLSTFPSNTGSQTLSIDITEEQSVETTSGSSVSAKLGGGIETEGEDIFGLVDMGTKVTVGSSQEKEYECAKIETHAVGTTFEGVVFGQGDGMNVSGHGEKKADFNWRLLHYIYDQRDENQNSVRQFPVITYLLSGVTQPEGVIPTSVTVTPAARSVEQVGPKTPGYKNTAGGFTVRAEGVTREAYTALCGAPLGMTLESGGNIGVGTPFSFGISINGNVLPGEYTLRLNVGGVLSNPFTVTVTEYEEPIYIEADKTALDFGSVRYNYGKGTPAASAQTVTIKNIHTETVSGLSASLLAGDDSAFVVSTPLSSDTLYAKGLPNSSATVSVRPKERLSVGTHTDTLIVDNGITSASVMLTYTVTSPTIPGAPGFVNPIKTVPNPVRLFINAPEDDGGGKMKAYRYTVLGHEYYLDENGEQIYYTYASDAQSGTYFQMWVDGEFTVGETYTIGVKAVSECGEGPVAYDTFTICNPENDPNPPRNVKGYGGDGKAYITWDDTDYWGENEDYPVIFNKAYRIGYYWNGTEFLVGADDNCFSQSGLTNGTEYTFKVYAVTDNRESFVTVKITPSAESTAPSRPTKFKADGAYRRMTLSWNAPDFDGNTDIVSYEVSKDGGESYVDTEGATEYTFTELTTNREYTFLVRAVNAVGKGDPAVLTAAPPSKLSAPTVNGVNVGYEQLELDFVPNTEESVTGYELSVNDGAWERIEPIAFNGSLRYILSGLENGKAYKLCLRAVDGEGGGRTAVYTRTPSENAPKPLKNAGVEPLNGGIRFFGEKADENGSMRYFVDGERYSWSFSNGYACYGYENGKEYTVSLYSDGYGSNGAYYCSAAYFTVKPDASIPKAPSEPIVKTYLTDETVRLVWSVEDNGGAPIESWTVSFRDDEIELPADQTELTLHISEADRKRYYYSRFYVRAKNSAGTSEGGAYIDLDLRLDGSRSVLLPSEHGKFLSEPFALVAEYTMWDENDEPYTERQEVTGNTSWGFASSDERITWDSVGKRIAVSETLPDGAYTATVSVEYRESVVYERTVAILVGEQPAILSAVKGENGVAVTLELSGVLGNVTLHIAAYDKNGALTAAAFRTVSAESLENGSLFVPIETQNAKDVKVFLLQDNRSLKPLCEGVLAK